MTENQDVLKERLQQLLAQKKSRKYYAKRLGISENEVKNLISQLRGEVTELTNYVTQLEETVTCFEEDVKNSKAQLTAKVRDEIKTLDELIEKCKIDTSKWIVDKYVQNYWGNQKDPHWQVKAYLSRRKPGDDFQKEFLKFLSTYKPTVNHRTQTFKNPEYHNNGCLIINKQDEHLNKLDIYGDNDIDERFKRTHTAVGRILDQAWCSGKINRIIYVVGSDQFNSEWTNATTKGTPQQNIHSYQEAFHKICNYEIEMISLLQAYTPELVIMYIPGNHDEYVGWHLIKWLEAFYKSDTDIIIDTGERYSKYWKYGNTAMMFNHGDSLKAQELARLFPLEFKEEWSNCENYYIFTGDKHHEVSMDLGGIKFYQLPSLSNARSKWDEKRGFVPKNAELTAFLIDEEKGITNIYKQPIR